MQWLRSGRLAGSVGQRWSSNGEQHRTRIEPAEGWQMINWRELLAYRDLFLFLVLRDVRVVYKQTVLGFTWAIIRPIFQMVVFTVVFGNMAEVSSDGIPYAIFSYVALVPWNYFSSAMTASTTSLVSNTAMLTKVYFPRLVIPLTPVLVKFVDFVIGFMVVGALMAWYEVVPTTGLFFVPLLIVLMMLTAAGVGLWLSALALQYRDVKQITWFMSQILMYAAPVIWPMSLIAEHFGETARVFYGLYPMVGVIEGFRSAVIGAHPMPWDLIGMGALTAVVLFVTGAFYFKRMEHRFADVA